MVRFVGLEAPLKNRDLTEIDRVREIEVIGFTPNVTESISLNSLRSMDDFLTYLERLETVPAAISSKLAVVQALLPQVSVREIWQKWNGFWEIDRDRAVERLNSWFKYLLLGDAVDGLVAGIATKEGNIVANPDRSVAAQELETLDRLSYDIDELMADWIDSK